jgi:tRNA1Val (adenine37-N6)-methyltransferase
MPLGDSSGVAPSDDEDVCYLTGEFRLFQKQRGHRWSLDDLITAWFAASEAKDPARCLDLGCGIGSVLLMTAWRFERAQCLGVEAQSLSAALARKSIAWNGVGNRVQLVEADFRSTALERKFDLVTGTPPYFPIGTGTLSEKVQAAPCRFEHRGGVEAYCEAASRALADDGTFVFCESANQLPRVEAALKSHGLHLRRWVDVIPREGKQPLVSVFSAQRSACVAEQQPPLKVRDGSGQWTAEFLSVRAAMGMPPRP